MDESNTKKYINNSINYTINKKINFYNDRIDMMMLKIEENFELSNKIMKLLEKNVNLENKINELEDVIKNMNSESIIKKKITNVSCNIKHIEKNNDIELKSIYKELKKEFFDLDESFVKECLTNTSLNDDIRMFKKMYIDGISKEYYPIRHIKKKLQYWCDGRMIDDDSNGTYIKTILLKNIEECYFKINQYENYVNNIEQFLKNQEHISKLSEQKYKDKFLQKIIQIISI